MKLRPFRPPASTWPCSRSAFVVACGWDSVEAVRARVAARSARRLRCLIPATRRAPASSCRSTWPTERAPRATSERRLGVRERSSGAFDLGLALFQSAERYGQRPGHEEVDAGVPVDPTPQTSARRRSTSPSRPSSVASPRTTRSRSRSPRARAVPRGNLLFLDLCTKEAVRAYDATLELAPGMHDSGPISVGEAGRVYNPDLLGRDAAWNRAIAPRRIEDQQTPARRAATTAVRDGGGDARGDNRGRQGRRRRQTPDSGTPDAGKDGGGKDAGEDSGSPDQPRPPSQTRKRTRSRSPPPSRQNQDERMLDQLENAPTGRQQETARKMGQRRPGPGPATTGRRASRPPDRRRPCSRPSPRARRTRRSSRSGRTSSNQTIEAGDGITRVAAGDGARRGFISAFEVGPPPGFEHPRRVVGPGSHEEERERRARPG